jgi:hypothetical protein
VRGRRGGLQPGADRSPVHDGVSGPAGAGGAHEKLDRGLRPGDRRSAPTGRRPLVKELQSARGGDDTLIGNGINIDPDDGREPGERIGAGTLRLARQDIFTQDSPNPASRDRARFDLPVADRCVWM